MTAAGHYSQQMRQALELHRDKLRQIKLFLTDVDGVLTDGKVYWAGKEIGFNRFFHASDGYAMRFLMANGIKVGIISGGESLGVIERVGNLQLDYMKLGDEDKRQGYLEIVHDCGVSDREVLYIGDEFFDLPLLRRVGFSAAPPHADPEVQQACDYVTAHSGGEGCVREVANLLRWAQDIVPLVEDF